MLFILGLRHAENAEQPFVHGLGIAVITANHDQQPNDENDIEQIQETFHA